MDRTDPNGLVPELLDQLSKYTDEVAAKVKRAAGEAAKELVANTKAAAPSDRGKYKKAITAKTDFENRYEKRKLWYVKAPHYRLAHLLEDGHKIGKTSKRTRARPHIRENEEKAVEKFQRRVLEAIQDGS